MGEWLTGSVIARNPPSVSSFNRRLSISSRISVSLSFGNSIRCADCAGAAEFGSRVEPLGEEVDERLGPGAIGVIGSDDWASRTPSSARAK